jgi:hypothetical protein
MPFGRKPATLEAYERKALDDYFKSMSRADPFMRAVRDLVHAKDDAARRAVVAREPELASERGAAGLNIVVTYAVMTGLVTTLPRLQELQAWQRSLGEPAPSGDRPAPPADVNEMLAVFAGAAARADQAFLRTGELGEIRQGIDTWRQIQDSGVLGGMPPESLVDALLMVAMLHARLYEVEHDERDLDAAFGFLREVEPHLVPGSHNDLLMRMSSATWLMLRFEQQGDPHDFDGAVAGYEDIRAVAPPGDLNGAIASANLGRALLIRHETSHSEADLRRARERLWEAERALPAGHPIRAEIQRQQARASWR